MKIQYIARGIVFIISFLITVTTLEAKKFNQEATINNPVLIQKEEYKNWCSFSAYELLATYKTNYIAKLSDGHHKQYASLRFLASDYDAIKSRLTEVLVVDGKTEELIDATRAYFVVNSKAQTKYSKYSKIAFKNKEHANEFKKEYGGDIRDFEFVLYMATRDISTDEEHFMNLQNKLYKMGAKLFEKRCQNINVTEYPMLLDLKASILKQNICGKINQRDLQLVSKYLWDKKRLNLSLKNTKAILVPEDSKCPVCGMFVAKYPKWVAKIQGEHTYYFDGVKDMMKYIFSKDIQTQNYDIKVTDYYTVSGFDASKAFYVVDSNVYGPMGHELIPFDTKVKAQKFTSDHGGKIYTFEEITLELVASLDS